MGTTTCKAKRKDGTQCLANAGASGYCWSHDPALGAKRASAHRHGGRNRRKHISAQFPEGVDVKTANGLLGFMETVIHETYALEPGVARSRTLGSLVQVQRGVLEVGELENRICALEEQFSKAEKERLAREGGTEERQ